MPRILLVPLLLFFAGNASAQQPRNAITVAEEHYHEAARQYVKGDNEQATRTAERGLAAAPSYEKLQKLLDLIRQQQEHSENSNDETPNREEDSSERPSPDDSNQGNKAPEQQENAPQEESPDTNQRQQRVPQGNADSDPGSLDQDQAGAMTRMEAARLLDAVGAEERLLLEKIRRAPTRDPEKDW